MTDWRRELRDLARDTAEDIAKIREHGARADGIIGSMLAHSRGQPGERRPTDLNALVRDYVSLAFHGMRAQDTARQMRYVDHSVQLIACGSSGPFMPTYLEWDREVLEQCYDYVDGLSLHRYLGNTNEETGEDSSKYVAMNLTMDRQIAETLAVCDLVRGHKRSPKKLWLSFDEWNVWRAQWRRSERAPQGGATSPGRDIRLGRCASGRRHAQHSDAKCRPCEDCLPGATHQRHCTYHDE